MGILTIVPRGKRKAPPTADEAKRFQGSGVIVTTRGK